jgi:hypothetical protein
MSSLQVLCIMLTILQHSTFTNGEMISNYLPQL